MHGRNMQLFHNVVYSAMSYACDKISHAVCFFKSFFAPPATPHPPRHVREGKPVKVYTLYVRTVRSGPVRFGSVRFDSSGRGGTWSLPGVYNPVP